MYPRHAPVERFLEWYGNRKSVVSVRGALAVLRAILVWAYQRKVLPSRPHIEMPASHAAIRAPKFLSHAQLGKLLAAAAERWRTWILVAVRTGLRCGEMLVLRWKAIDLKKRELNVLASLNDYDEETAPKSHQARAVPLSAQAMAALEAVKPEKVDGEQFVLPTIRTRHQAAGALARISTAAGLGRVGPHRLRHTFWAREPLSNRGLRPGRDPVGVGGRARPGRVIENGLSGRMKAATLTLALVALMLGAAELMARAYFPSKPLFAPQFPDTLDCEGPPPCRWRPDYIHPVPGSRLPWPVEFRRGGRTSKSR